MIHHSQLSACVSSFIRFRDHPQRRTIDVRTPLNDWPARRKDLYLTTTHKIHNRQTSMPTVGFEPIIPAGELPQTYAFDRAATGTSIFLLSSTTWNHDTPSSGFPKLVCNHLVRVLEKKTK